MFVWLLAASAVWCLGSAFEGLSHTVGEKIFWSKVQYVGISGVGPLWFLFLAQYVGSAVGSNRRVRYAMIGMAAVTNAIAFTNDFHGLMWTSVTLSPLDVGIACKASSSISSGAVMNVGWYAVTPTSSSASPACS